MVELLTFLSYRSTEALNLVTGALETVSISNDAGNSPYASWFTNFEKSISGQGKMGSLVKRVEGMPPLRAKSTSTRCVYAGSRGHSRSRQPARETAKRRQRRTACPPSASQCRQHEGSCNAIFRQRTTHHLRYCAGHAGTAQDERIRVGIFRTCLAHDSVGAQATSIMRRRRRRAGQSWQHPRDGERIVAGWPGNVSRRWFGHWKRGLISTRCIL